MSTTNSNFEVKPYSLTELANLYSVTNRTMKNWLAPHAIAIGQKVGRLYTALQIKIIFEKIGLPGRADEG